jgi:hypothetical protein
MESIIFRHAPREFLSQPISSTRSGQENLRATESDKLLSQQNGRSPDRLYSEETTGGDVLSHTSGHSMQPDGPERPKALGVSNKAASAVGCVIESAKGASELASHAVRSAGNMIGVVAAGRDGEYYNGGFVSFRTLSLKYAALQMLHHDIPFVMSVSEAPGPQDVFWTNVGREHEDLQLGRLFSRTASVAICFLWTIPIAFIASLSSVESLKRQFEFVEKAIDEFPALEPILQQLAPLLLLLSNVM